MSSGTIFVAMLLVIPKLDKNIYSFSVYYNNLMGLFRTKHKFLDDSKTNTC